MKLLHLSDLHIGKVLNNALQYEDQQFIFGKILEIIDEESPDGILIAGDVYDHAVPSTEAVMLCDSLLNDLAAKGKPVFIIAGNHDSAERLSFAGSFLKRGNIHVSRKYDGHIEPVTLRDEYGTVNIYLMPYLRPEEVAVYFKDVKIRTANDAAAAVIGAMGVDTARRNVILSHQFIVGSKTSESERKSVGTLEDVDASLYDAFDYVALGHLHRPQNVGRADGTMRYSGTPLMYSRSEMNVEKSVTIVELGEKNQVNVTTRRLEPLHGMRVYRGTFDELMEKNLSEREKNDYCYIDLTDEQEVPNANSRLREHYPLLLQLNYDNKRTRSNENSALATDGMELRSPLMLMQELYEKTHNHPMSDEALCYVEEMIKIAEDSSHEAD